MKTLITVSLALIICTFCPDLVYGYVERDQHLCLVQSSTLPELRDIILNEVLYEPLSNEAEFVEIYNTSAKSFLLKDLSIQVGDGSLRKIYNTEPNRVLNPREYLVLTDHPSSVMNIYPNSDPSLLFEMDLPQLRNAGNSIRLYYHTDSVIILLDSMTYHPDNHISTLASPRGTSLERIYVSGHWTSSLERATPTRRNSVALEGTGPPLSMSIAYSEVVSPNGDGWQDEFFVTLSAEEQSYRYDCHILDAQGREIAELRRNSPLLYEDRIHWPMVQQRIDGHYFIQIRIITDDGKTDILIKPFVIIR